MNVSNHEPPRFLALAGSTRTGSVNKRAVMAVQALGSNLGMTINVTDLANYEMPIYNGDIEKESGLPLSVVRLKELIESHSGLILASPEFNGSLSPLMKNVLDWVSRPGEEQANLASFKNKCAFILSASPGRLGGVRGLSHLRHILSSMGVHVVPQDCAIAGAFQAFGDGNTFANQSDATLVEIALRQLNHAAVAMAAAEAS